MNLDSTLYFSSISFNAYYAQVWDEIYASCDYPGKFFMNIGKRLSTNRFVTRHGEWSLPWKQELIPGFEMPDYNTFTKSFSDVCDSKALSIKSSIHEGNKFALMYSGGIDSTVILVSLLKNLSTTELRNIVICCSADSIIENPLFFNNYNQ